MKESFFFKNILNHIVFCKNGFDSLNRFLFLKEKNKKRNFFGLFIFSKNKLFKKLAKIGFCKHNRTEKKHVKTGIKHTK